MVMNGEVVGIDEIVFKYQNGTTMRLTGQDAQKFCAATLGKNRDLDKYIWDISDPEQPKKKRNFTNRFIQWFLKQ